MRRLHTGFPVWTSIPRNKEKHPGCQPSKGQSGGKGPCCQAGWQAAPTNSAGQADSGSARTCAHQVPSALCAACRWRPLWACAGRHCRCVVEVQVRSQKPRPFLNQCIYWTLCRAVLLRGSPLTSHRPLHLTRASSQSVLGGQSGERERHSKNPEVVNRILTNRPCPHPD